MGHHGYDGVAVGLSEAGWTMSCHVFHVEKTINKQGGQFCRFSHQVQAFTCGFLFACSGFPIKVPYCMLLWGVHVHTYQASVRSSIDQNCLRFVASKLSRASLVSTAGLHLRYVLFLAHSRPRLPLGIGQRCPSSRVGRCSRGLGPWYFSDARCAFFVRRKTITLLRTRALFRHSAGSQNGNCLSP